MRMVKLLKSFFLISLILVLVVLADVLFETNFPKVEKITLTSVKIPKGVSLKILQITDLHDKQFGKDNWRLLKAVKNQEVDFIAITGDLVDVETVNYEHTYGLIDNLLKINANVFFVSGNHERWNVQHTQLINRFKESGMRVLNNSYTVFQKENLKINLCGIEYLWVNVGGENKVANSSKNYAQAFKGIDKSRYTVLLSHAPKIIDEMENIPADLILSGHTHGGQVRLPVIGGLISPEGRYFPGFDKGLYNLPRGNTLYIDSGLGASLYPVRLFNRSQMSLITIKSPD